MHLYHRSFSPRPQLATCHVVHIMSVSIDADDSVPLALSRLGSAKAPVVELPTHAPFASSAWIPP